MAEDDDSLAGTSASKKAHRVRELFPIQMGSRGNPNTRDFRPHPVTESPTSPPATEVLETVTEPMETPTDSPTHPSILPAD